jgi:hypothetical protein
MPASSISREFSHELMNTRKRRVDKCEENRNRKLDAAISESWRKVTWYWHPWNLPQTSRKYLVSVPTPGTIVLCRRGLQGVENALVLMKGNAEGWGDVGGERPRLSKSLFGSLSLSLGPRHTTAGTHRYQPSLQAKETNLMLLETIVAGAKR